MDIDAMEKGTPEQQRLLGEFAEKARKLETIRASTMSAVLEEYKTSDKSVADAAEFLRNWNATFKIGDRERDRIEHWLMGELLGADPAELAEKLASFLGSDDGPFNEGAIVLMQHKDTGEVRLMRSDGEPWEITDAPTEMLEILEKIGHMPGMYDGRNIPKEAFDAVMDEISTELENRRKLGGAIENLEAAQAAGIATIEGIGAFEDIPVLDAKAVRDFDGGEG